MPFPKHVVCISTTKPTNSVTASGGGGSLTMMDPQTGSILSSLRTSADLSGKTAMGMSTISDFPQAFSNTNLQLVMAYGGNSVKKGDTYAMLLSIRSASSPPILHWKCRLPEADLTGGLSVSPCGHYVVGGGSSGSCFVWSSVGGNLLRTFKAHYRAVRCLAWSDCGRYLVTGGADGMVHLFPLIDLSDRATRKSKRTIAPLHTWSFHHFPVTCLTSMKSGRMASAAEDGQVVIMELFSKEILATIKFPTGIECMTHHDGRLYSGSTGGTIFIIDLDAYAMHQTEKQGASLTKRQRLERQKVMTNADKVFGKSTMDENSSTLTYQSEWIGHEYPVRSIAFVTEDLQQLLISGDDAGQVRIWDVESRTCLKVIRPWSNASGTTVSKKDPTAKAVAPTKHPITSILIVPQPSESASSGMFGAPASSSRKNQSSIANLVAPLQKYSQEEAGSGVTVVPFLKPNRTAENLEHWQARTLSRKPKQNPSHITSLKGANGAPSKDSGELEQAKNMIAELQNELEKKKEEVLRWEKVNNKLMAKMQTKK